MSPPAGVLFVTSSSGCSWLRVKAMQAATAPSVSQPSAGMVRKRSSRARTRERISVLIVSSPPSGPASAPLRVDASGPARVDAEVGEHTIELDRFALGGPEPAVALRARPHGCLGAAKGDGDLDERRLAARAAMVRHRTLRVVLDCRSI